MDSIQMDKLIASLNGIAKSIDELKKATEKYNKELVKTLRQTQRPNITF